MSSVDLKNIATVLRKVAEYVDANESAKIAAVQMARLKTLEAFKAKYAEASGEELPDYVVSKLADSGKDVVDALAKIASVEEPDSLGGAAPSRDKTASVSVKEQAEAASEAFLDFLIN